MSTIVSRLDITEIFCDVDDFCKQWQHLWQQIPQLPSAVLRPLEKKGFVHLPKRWV